MVIILFLTACETGFTEVKITSDSMDLVGRGNITEFYGNVKLKGENFVINSEKAVSDKSKGVIKASGDVDLKYTSSTWRITGSCRQIFVETETKEITMEKDVNTEYISYDTGENPVYVSCDKVLIKSAGKKRAEFKGNVNAKRSNIEIESGQGVYYQDEKRIEFTDKPFARGIFDSSETIYNGEIIQIDLNKNRVEIKNNVHARVYLSDTEM
ncbi:MAG: hypothetical protein ACOC5R_04795 [Elusimicrobiota bacterium]